MGVNVLETFRTTTSPQDALSHRPIRPKSLLLFTSILAFLVLSSHVIHGKRHISPQFYHKVTKSVGICGLNLTTVSHAGHIGLLGDSDTQPKRSFFWYFDAEENSADAPIILTVGGGPGTSGMMNPLSGQSPCIATEGGLAPNPHRWTENYNLIALDHPIGVGFSYGTHVSNSRSAAYDVYDFLQKFFVLFPHLAGNKFVISGGSYGGVYVPHIATVIHEQNLALQAGYGVPQAVHINLEALILSNSFTSPMSHFRWLLKYRCLDHHVYNSTDCKMLYSDLPNCLESIELAFENPTTENRVTASKLCYNRMNSGDPHGTVHEDIRRKCIPESNAPEACHPEFGWIQKIFNDSSVRSSLGVPDNIEFTPLNMRVNFEFHAAGDLIQEHHLMFPPLIASGIRVLHYVGAQDANCPWPGVLSFLKLLQTPFQEDFIMSPDIPWPSEDVATVRTVGEGAGTVAFIVIREAGHFTVKDQPALAKLIVEHWVSDRPFF